VAFSINNMDNFLEQIKKEFELNEIPLNEYSPLVLAYIGDVVYELIIRCRLVLNANEAVEKLHKKATWYVKAESQRKLVDSFMEELSEEEEAVFKRARNAKVHTTPKNAKIGDYHRATGFEALIGYLYLKGDTDRIFELVKKGIYLLDE